MAPPVGTDPITPLQSWFTAGQAYTDAALAPILAGAGRGTGARFRIANLAAADALATAVIGDTAFLETPGTGIFSLNMTAYVDTGTNLDWHIDDIVVADTKAHLDSFISAVSAIPDVRFEVGGEAFVTGTNIKYRFSSAAGGYIAQPSGIIASGVLTGVSSFNIDGLDGASDYEVVLQLPTSSTSNDLNLVLRNNGTADTSSNYDYQNVVGAAAITAAGNAFGGSSWPTISGAARARKTYILRTIGLNLAESTVLDFTATTFDATTNPRRVSGGLVHRLSQSFNGLGFTTSTGTVTGRYEVRAI